MISPRREICVIIKGTHVANDAINKMPPRVRSRLLVVRAQESTLHKRTMIVASAKRPINWMSTMSDPWSAREEQKYVDRIVKLLAKNAP